MGLIANKITKCHSYAKPSRDTKLEGFITAPGILITVGKGKLELGSPNPYYINPKNPIRDLMSKGFNLHTTFVASNLKDIIQQATLYILEIEKQLDKVAKIAQEQGWHDLPKTEFQAECQNVIKEAIQEIRAELESGNLTLNKHGSNKLNNAPGSKAGM